jgi:NAD(P)-dependent dehydrogenase (short-subunit alcohol dehydrogenase family)
MAGVLLVTGGGRGIGAATARLGAADGYAVCVNYLRDEAAAGAVVDAILAAGGRAIAVQGDVASEPDVLRLFETVDLNFGRVTALVNNAGIVDVQARVEAMSLERLQRMFAVNVIGSFLCAREAVKRMSTRHGGSGGAIVNVSSGAARTGAPAMYVDYAASKGALDTMTVGLAKEVAVEGIRVNGVHAGFTYTDIHASAGIPDRVERMKEHVPMKRGAQPEEIARAILWLLSGAASYSTGAILDVTGGS